MVIEFNLLYKECFISRIRFVGGLLHEPDIEHVYMMFEYICLLTENNNVLSSGRGRNRISERGGGGSRLLLSTKTRRFRMHACMQRFLLLYEVWGFPKRGRGGS